MIEIFLILILVFPKLISSLAAQLPKIVRHDWVYLLPAAYSVLTVFVLIHQKPFELIFLFIGESYPVGFRFDTLSCLVSIAVTLIGASVMRYSVRYLADDPNRIEFHKNLSSTLCLVLMMLHSSSLLGFWLAWLGTSFFLHKLLLHFKDREGAITAAREKFWVSRVGDAFILAASLILYKVFGTLDFELLVSQSLNAQALQENSALLHIAAVFLVLGAMTKSAQFPFHYWLPKTMETPTPVSALMHAGIINAGGFLVVRMGSLFNHTPVALSLLAFVGGFTAIYGTLLMLTQTSVKKSLAYSTISQMGFMMLQCGLGAFSIAVVHIIGHAFYKAYSFLGSGTATDYGRLRRYLGRPTEAAPAIGWSVLLASVMAVLFVFVVGPFFGYAYQKPGALVLLTVLGLALAQIFITYKNKVDALKSMGLLFLFYFALYQIVEKALSVSIQTHISSVASYQYILEGLLILCFVLLFLFQNSLPWVSSTKIGRKLYLKSLNGGLRG